MVHVVSGLFTELHLCNEWLHLLQRCTVERYPDGGKCALILTNAGDSFPGTEIAYTSVAEMETGPVFKSNSKI